MNCFFFLLTVLAVRASVGLPRERRNAPFTHPGFPPVEYGFPRYPHPIQPKPFGSAICRLMSVNSSMVVGEIFLDQVSSVGPVELQGEVFGLTPGRHGFHVHENGDTSEKCEKTGDHFNPTNKKHGAPDNVQRHAGDLGNIVAGADGVARIAILDSEISLVDGNPRNIIGRSIVVQVMEDDLGKGEEEGTEMDGEKAACCVIEAPKFFF